MKSKLTISKDGFNKEEFDNLDCFDSEKEIEDYSVSAVNSIAKAMLNLKVNAPFDCVKTLYDKYVDYDPYNQREESKTTWIVYLARLKQTLDNNNENFYIDDIIALLRVVKPWLNSTHLNQYSSIRKIILDSCQLEDESMI